MGGPATVGDKLHEFVWTGRVESKRRVIFLPIQDLTGHLWISYLRWPWPRLCHYTKAGIESGVGHHPKARRGELGNSWNSYRNTRAGAHRGSAEKPDDEIDLI